MSTRNLLINSFTVWSCIWLHTVKYIFDSISVNGLTKIPAEFRKMFGIFRGYFYLFIPQFLAKALTLLCELLVTKRWSDVKRTHKVFEAGSASVFRWWKCIYCGGPFRKHCAQPVSPAGCFKGTNSEIRASSVYWTVEKVQRQNVSCCHTSSSEPHRDQPQEAVFKIIKFRLQLYAKYVLHQLDNKNKIICTALNEHICISMPHRGPTDIRWQSFKPGTYKLQV